MDIFELALDIQSKGLEHAKKVLRDIDTSGKGVAKNFDAITAPVNKLKAAFGALGVVISAAAVGTLFKRAIQEAGDAEAAMASLEQAVENTGGNFSVLGVAAESAAKNIQKLTRFSDDAAIGALATMTTIAGSGEKAIRNLGLAADIAAAKHIDLDSAATLVGRVLAGNTSMLKRYGIVVKEGSDAMQQLREKFSGFAEKDGATFQGRLEQMRNAFFNVLEAIGRLVTGSTDTADALKKIRDWMDRLSAAIDENSGKWRDWAKGAFEATSDWYAGFQERSRNVAHWFDVIAAAANSAGAAIRTFLQQGNAGAWQDLIETQRKLNAAINNQFADVSGGGSTQGAQQLPTVTIGGTRVVDRAGRMGGGTGGGGIIDQTTPNRGPHMDNTPGGFTPSPTAGDMPDMIDRIKTDIIDGMNEAQAAFDQRMSEMAAEVTQGITQTLGDALFNGFSAAFSGKGLGGIFSALGKTVLSGLGQVFVLMGQKMVMASQIMIAFQAALKRFFGAGGLVAGLALIALGSAMGALSGGGRGASGANAASFSNRGTATEEITRLKFVDRLGNPSANLVPRPPMVFNVFGPDDPKAQRAIVQAIDNYGRR